MITLIVPTMSSNVVARRPVFIRDSIAAPLFDLRSSYALRSTSVSLDTSPTDGLALRRLA